MEDDAWAGAIGLSEMRVLMAHAMRNELGSLKDVDTYQAVERSAARVFHPCSRRLQAVSSVFGGTLE